jgi:dolichyl-phosphate-mannose-protein mannosyltransferase
MARSQTPQGSLRQRNVPGKKTTDATTFDPQPELDKLAKAAAQKQASSSELDHKISFSIITLLAFVTRFWGISHPNEVVFDEVHFGKVRDLYTQSPLRPRWG